MEIAATFSLNSTAGSINTTAGTVDARANNGNAGAIALTAKNDIITGNIFSLLYQDAKGNSGNISLNSTAGSINTTAGTLDSGVTFGNAGAIALTALKDITTANLRAQAPNGGLGNGGNISLISTTGAINTSAGGIFTTSDNGNGGAINLTASDRITTGIINSSAGGNGGAVTIDPVNDIQVTSINTQGGLNGGNVDITTTRGFFRALGSFTDRNRQQASISTAGRSQGGTIIIRHWGGARNTPFVVGDATINGTAGVITRGAIADNTILTGRSFLGTYKQDSDRIQIITPDQPIIVNPPDVVNQPVILDGVGKIIQESPIPGEKLPPPPNVPSVVIDSIVAGLDESFTRQFDQYLSQADTPIKSLREIQENLDGIEKATGVKPAIIYVAFIPQTVAPTASKEEGKESPKSGVRSLESNAKTLNSKLSHPTSIPESDVVLQFSSQHVVTKRVRETFDRIAQSQTPSPTKSLAQDSDQLELVVVTAKQPPVRKRIGVTRSQVLQVAKTFRGEVVNPRKSRSYLASSQQLYQWLVAPLEADLQERKVENLAFVMDSGLRSLPVAALHNGKYFLVERYSTGLMPSLSLTDTRYVDIKKASVLSMGASHFTNQKPLPAVPVELETIIKLWSGKEFLNEGFTLDNLKTQRRQQPFGIIHLATHGEFKSGEPSNSYIQFWDSQLQLDRMRLLGFNNPPVELIVLSACRSALGDEQAELGFAGFAIQAGAKSAVASLWNVSDEGTLGLMTDFYDKLKKAPIKAEALRQAQKDMIAGRVRLEDGKLRISAGDVSLPPELAKLPNHNLSHPYYWAAFTLIGNPW